MPEKTIKCLQKSLPRLLICLLFIIQLVPSGMAVEEIKVDYSGWSLTDAFADLAMRAHINILCAFPDQKNGYFKLNETVYFEEAMHLLANINRLQIRRNDNIWVIVPEDSLPESDHQSTTIRDLTFRDHSELGSRIELMKMPEVKLWFPPKTEIIAATGPKVGLTEIKKLKETIDTPVHALQVGFYLKSPTDKILASCTFNGVSNQPLALTFASPGKAKISIAGTPALNDDGIIRFAFTETLVTPHGRQKKTDNIFMHHQTPVEHRISMAGTDLIIGWQINVVQLHGRLAPENAGRIARMSAGFQENTQTEDETPLRHYTEIWHSTTESLEKPLILRNAEIQATLADLARQQNIRLICDSSVSGSVSVFCFDESLDRDMLLRTIAMIAGGWHEDNGITFVSSRRAIMDMQLSPGQPVFSEPLKAVSAASAAFMLNSFFKEAGIPGSVSPVAGNRVAVISDRQGNDLAIKICEDWSAEPPRFNLGISGDKQQQGAGQKLSLQNGKSADFVHKTVRTRIKGSLRPSVISRELGLLNVAFRFEISYQNGDHLRIDSSSQIRATSPMLLLHSQVPASEKIYLSGHFSRKFPEEKLVGGESPLDAPEKFDPDKAFDSEF